MRLPGELISHICHIEYGEMSIALGIGSLHDCLFN